MAIRYKGEVEFQDSTGATFVLRLGQFQMVANQKALAALSGQEHQTQVFLIALRAGAESQKDFTTEDAAEIIDDIGFKKLGILLKQTKFYHNINEAQEIEEADKKAAAGRAVLAIRPKVERLKKSLNGDGGGAALDKVLAMIDAMQPKEGAENPPEETPSSS